MWWFHTSNERKMQARLKQRAATAQILKRDLRFPKLLTNNRQLVKRAFASADEDVCVYAELFGEPLPIHWRNALRLETDLWSAINMTLESWQGAPESQREQAGAVRAELDRIEGLLTLEGQMLHSPLTKHFSRELERLT